MKYLITESQLNDAIDKFITFQLEPHQEMKHKQYPESLFWVKNGNVVVKIKDNEFFLVDYDIWNLITEMFAIRDFELRDHMKKWLEKHYGITELKPKQNIGILMFPSSMKDMIKSKSNLDLDAPTDSVG